MTVLYKIVRDCRASKIAALLYKEGCNGRRSAIGTTRSSWNMISYIWYIKEYTVRTYHNRLGSMDWLIPISDTKTTNEGCTGGTYAAAITALDVESDTQYTYQVQSHQ